MFRILLFFPVLLAALCPPLSASAQDGRPPASVVVDEVRRGDVAPTNRFVGSVYFGESSQVASEVAGRVESYHFDHGGLVGQGDVLARLNTELLRKELEAKRAELEQARVNLRQAELDYRRLKQLFESGSVSQQEYDDKRFARLALQSRVASLEAEVARLDVEISKAVIRAPFDGVVLSRDVARGEWLDVGQAIGEIGRHDVMRVVVEVPQEVLAHLPEDGTVSVTVGGRELSGENLRLAPKGSISTRTFPVHVDVPNPGFLAEGMEAVVSLPSAGMRESLLVPRDAVISVRGTLAVFAVRGGKAVMVPVEVVGYQGMSAGISPKAPLEPGESVVVKGNERLRPDQPVNPQPVR
ncbi:efflux RND transporter periplasmic adaptor subunit [Desulfohalovibrio reitneri]|uniref:efflux RND transporter periplasmic adaptor subunit n=1 Tax=Desulfohalovibrio reitneri TaxID=1307759 RepID=UPI0004A71888|nr:efflux RND transporter periplasmic adaptor subunit [Desulfohalovibrio reitneri]